MKGINIELTPCQFDYLYEVIMMAYELEVPEQKGWDIQTYDNMVCLLYTSPSPRDSMTSRMPSSA